jgi:16S rRNA (adenine1518-N6/adenine1519-N6)-dimethyltransferase
MAKIPAKAFYPTPKVDSAVVRVDLYTQPLIARHLLPLFFRLAKAGFHQKRKTLRNALAGGMHWTPQQSQQILAAAGIESQRRAESLNLEEWGQLVDEVYDLGFR